MQHDHIQGGGVGVGRGSVGKTGATMLLHSVFSLILYATLPFLKKKVEF